MTRITAPFLLLLALAACETAEGFGQDVSSAGSAISGTANDAEQELEN